MSLPYRTKIYQFTSCSFSISLNMLDSFLFAFGCNMVFIIVYIYGYLDKSICILFIVPWFYSIKGILSTLYY